MGCEDGNGKAEKKGGFYRGDEEGVISGLDGNIDCEMIDLPLTWRFEEE